MAVRNKIKAKKARIQADKEALERILRRYGAGGLESRQLAFIAEMDSNYVSHLLISLRQRGTVESWRDADARLQRWRLVGFAPPVASTKWQRDVPLESLDAEHQEWMRKTLAPKPKFNPFGGER